MIFYFGNNTFKVLELKSKISTSRLNDINWEFFYIDVKLT
jgi:hypothetical protein